MMSWMALKLVKVRHALRTVVAAVRVARAVVWTALAIACPARFKLCPAVVSAVRTV